jgi:acyl-CoA synthetase (AMP-forming)/AMP-acid ligase II
VRSDAVGCGYSDPGRPVEQPHETRCDGFAGEGFLMSDYGTFDAGGRLVLLGRTSSFVNVAGRKVQPAEVEQVLRTMPGVADARVVAAPDRRRGQQIVACVVADRRVAGVTALSVRRFCAGRLAAHKVPRAIVFLDAIPLTGRGKTDREALDAAVRASLPEDV